MLGILRRRWEYNIRMNIDIVVVEGWATFTGSG
jgi:hypothetical protein